MNTSHVAPEQTLALHNCRITYVQDDCAHSPETIMYPNTSQEDWGRHEDLTDGRDNVLLPFGGFLIETGTKKILMDLGTGEKALEYPVFGRVPGGAFLKSLSVAGAKPEDITDVFLTHMHMDHTGWTSVERDGRYILTFPNATY